MTPSSKALMVWLAYGRKVAWYRAERFKRDPGYALRSVIELLRLRDRKVTVVSVKGEGR